MRFRLAGLLCALLVSFPLAGEPPRGTPGAWYRYPLPGAEVKSLAADPALPGVFWAGTAQGGIYRSSDGGVSGTSPPGGALFPGYAVTSLAVDPTRSGAVWVGLTGVVKGGLLARSTDLGRSFEVVRRWEDRAGARVVAVTSRSGRKAVGVGGDWGLEISEDDGLTWRASAPPLDAGSGVSFMAFDPLRPGVLYCGSFRHPFRSLDGGLTWARIANGMVEDTEVFGIDFSPDDPNDFWAATCGWVYRTTDGGASWTRYREGLTDRRTHVVRVDPRDPNRILAGTTGGLFERRGASPPATVLSLASAGGALVAGAPDGSYRAASVGAPFTKVLDAGTRAFASDGEGRFLAATDKGVFESLNGGSAWRRLGSLKSRVEDVRRARLPESGLKTWSADAEGLTLWWDGTEW